ncbi:MAG: hypothetical protein HN368_07700, partial [Spirochaetales bacterium]|nr:hypothetical protein [Spirochaetales bacterium]
AVAGDFDAYNTLTFFARSNVASEGSLDIQDYQNDEYFWSDFNLSGSWSRIRLNLQEMGIYGYPGLSENLLLYFSFYLTPEMRVRVRQGDTIPIDLSFDDIVLEMR